MVFTSNFKRKNNIFTMALNAEKIKEILISNQITHPISEVLIQDSDLKGENMASVTQHVTVNFKQNDFPPLNLFVKLKSQNPTHLAMSTEMKTFQREATFYNDYLKECRLFCEQKGQLFLMDIYPKCYFADEDMVVLDNYLDGSDTGYILLNKIERQDFKSAEIALKTLAKHHAISYAFVQEKFGGKGEEFLKRFPIFGEDAFKTEAVKGMMQPIMENGVEINIKILGKMEHDEDGKEEALEILRGLKGNTFEKMLEALDDDDGSMDAFNVLNHGDFWNNNMLFRKDKETNEISGHIAVDFQLARYSTPGVDLGYYFFLSLKHEVRQRRLHDLLNVYLETLNNVTEDLGYPILLSFEQLFGDFRRKFKFGYFVGGLDPIGVNFEVFKEIDYDKIDMGQWASIFMELVGKWIENNKEKIEIGGQVLLKSLKEYKELSL